MSTITFLGQVVNIFWPIGPVFFGAMILFSIICMVINYTLRKSSLSDRLRLLKDIHPLLYFVILLVLMLASYKSSLLTENMDEYGYYLNTVKWIESYKTLPGIGLLNGRIAINSAWHMASAIFGYDFLYEGGVYDLNGLVSCFIFLLGFGSACRIYKHTPVTSASDILLMSALVFPFFSLIDSMDADYPTIFFGIFLISKIVRKVEQNSFFKIDTTFYAYTLIALFLFTIKPFSGVYLIYPVVVALNQFRLKQRRPLLIIAMLSLIYVTPWLYRNYLLSGYLIYPIHFIDLFDVDWKLPIEYVANTYLVIAEFAKIELLRADYLYTGVGDVSIIDWFPTWFNNNWSQLIGKLVTIALPIASLSSIIESFQKCKSKFYYLKLSLLILIIIWFVSFPAIRFGWSFVLSFLILSGVDILDRFKLDKKYMMYILTAGILFSLSRNVYKMSIHESTSSTWVCPETTPELKVHNPVTTNVTYSRSTTEYCYGKIPCVPVHNPWIIYLRTDNLRDGFTLEKSSSQ